MKILHVIPIARGIQKEKLSYFASVDAPAGSIISVPLRSRTVLALVVSSEEVSDAKTRIRTAGYAIKKTNARTARQVILPEFVNAASRSAEYYASTTGATLFSILPTQLFADPAKLDVPIAQRKKSESSVSIQKLLLQAPRSDRVEHYKNITREGFVRKESMHIVVPSIQEAERLYGELSRGISPYTFCLHGGMAKGTLLKSWKAVLAERHPVLIISTGSFLALPRSDIGTIVVERENSPLFKAQSRPFLDVRIFAETYAEELNARFILSDFPLSVSAIKRFQDKEYEECLPFKMRLPAGMSTTVVDMRDKEKKFSALGGEIRFLLEEARQENQHVFLFASRRGLSPITVCQDCGNTVVCDLTGAPVVLHKGTKENVFVCHASGTVRSAQERCRFCGSWKLQALGIGIELVEEEVRAAFPDLPCFVIEKDKAPSHKKAKEIAAAFYASSSGVLIGTEMALPYLTEQVQASAITSIDSFLSLPEWNIYERIFSILIRIREMTARKMIIQTRKPEQEILSLAASGNVNDFYKKEMTDRKQFGYPPYATLIKCTMQGTESALEKILEEIKNTITPFEFSGVSHHMHLGYGKYQLHAFLRLETKEWPQEELVEKLRSLPPSVAVTVDPQSIL